MLEARCSLGQGSQWGIWPTKRGAVWEVSFMLVLYLGTLYLGWECSRRGEDFFVTKVLIHGSFHCVDSCYCFHRDQKLRLARGSGSRVNVKQFASAIRGVWNIHSSHQLGTSQKAVMQLLWGAPQLAKAKLQHLRIQTKQNEAGRFSCSLAASTFQPETLGATLDPSTALVCPVLLMLSFIFSTSCNCT